jgi:hypothetical protein
MLTKPATTPIPVQLSAPAFQQLSLSRLNHRLPRGQTDPEGMQGTAQCHHEIADAVLPQPDAVFHNAAALHAAVDMLGPQPTVVQGLIGACISEFISIKSSAATGEDEPGMMGVSSEYV